MRMDYNKEKAIKARKDAERKFNSRDLIGAKKFALKAQNLFPELDGISQMVSTLDVYLAAEAKVSGENDWYAILSVSASADDETLKKNYRKLALQLHPDKNKSIGAEGAFKLVSEAWSVLSDQNRKMAYDGKRNINGFQQRGSQSHIYHSAQKSANGFYDFSQTTRKSKKHHKRHTYATQSSVPPPSHSVNSNTFWTSCNHCRMQYEYLRVYLNQNLSCPKCRHAFLAVEIGIPPNAVNSTVSWSAKQHKQNFVHNSTMKNNGYNPDYNSSTFPGHSPTEFQHGGNFNSYSHQNYHLGSDLGIAGSTNTTAFNVGNVSHKKLDKMKRKREAAESAVRMEDSHRSECYVSGSSVNGYDNIKSSFTNEHEQPCFKPEKPPKRRSITDYFSECDKNETENFALFTRSGGSSDLEKINGRVTRPYNFSKELLQINVRQLLMEKVRVNISKQLEDWDLANPDKLGDKAKSKQNHNRKYDKDEQVGAAVDANAFTRTEFDDSSAKNSPDSRDIASQNEAHRIITIDVPDPDFFDFDKDRLEKSFEGDQVWATYDSEDGMPRLYALVQKVISRKPFRIRMSFLNSKTNSELGPINWVGSGFPKTCGDFRVSRYQIGETVNIFSHRMKWEKGPRGVITILPKKGETWALYKNWSPDWNELTPDVVIYKYEMVEVLDDYNEEHGVAVTLLVKVAGFKAVFHQHLDPKETKRIPREEMFRFSHQVPSYLLTGEENHAALKGCRELDPAATPAELLQVITEVKDDVVVGSRESQPDG